MAKTLSRKKILTRDLKNRDMPFILITKSIKMIYLQFKVIKQL